jgi:hypothetical protein
VVAPVCHAMVTSYQLNPKISVSMSGIITNAF